MARLSREVIITEKIDGTNAQILIVPNAEIEGDTSDCLIQTDEFTLWAGSRTRWIGVHTDNHGFANWAHQHHEELLQLGPGRHFGEWWGSGIQRGYNLPKGEKRFSLFNVQRWCLHGTEPGQILTADPRIVKYQDVLPACCGLVPILHRGKFQTEVCEEVLACLRIGGSKASPGFMNPEGIVVFHVAGNFGLKKTIKNDDVPKGLQKS